MRVVHRVEALYLLPLAVPTAPWRDITYCTRGYDIQYWRHQVRISFPAVGATGTAWPLRGRWTRDTADAVQFALARLQSPISSIGLDWIQIRNVL